MSHDETKPPAADAGAPGPAETAAKAAVELSETLLRLLVGSAAEGADALLRALAARGAEAGRGTPAAPGAPPPGEDRVAARARLALIGLVFETSGAAGRGVTAAARGVDSTRRLLRAVLPAVGPRSLPRPLRLPYDYLVERGAQEVERWSRIGSVEEQRSREVAHRIAMTPVQDIVARLAEHPELERLVRRQARSLLAGLSDDPELASLVRAQGDRYVEHLHERPETIQQLVRGQSVGLAEEVAGAVRSRAGAADDLLERIARAVLLRRPRAERAGFGGFASRLSAFLIDSAVLSFVATIVAWAGVSLLAKLGIDVLACPALGEGGGLRPLACHVARIGGAVAAALLPPLYALFFWSTAGQTPGKRALGLRIVRLDGRPMTVTTSALRLAATRCR